MTKSPYDGLMDGMMEGAYYGSQVRIGRLERECAELRAIVKQLDVALAETKETLIAVDASRDGWRSLSKDLVAEIKDPTRPRLLSVPDNQEVRNDFLDEQRKIGEKFWVEHVYGKSGRPPLQK